MAVNVAAPAASDLGKVRLHQPGFLMMAQAQSSICALCILASLTGTSSARGDEVVRLAPGFAMAISVPGAEKGEFTAYVGKPAIADITFGPKNTFVVIGKTEGSTNIIALDKNSGREFFHATVQVGAGGQASARVYVGMPDSRTYLCSSSTCVPSGITTVTRTGESAGETETQVTR